MKPVVSYFRNPAIGQPARFGQRLPGPLQGSAPPEASPSPPIHIAPLDVVPLSLVGSLPPSEVASRRGASTAPPSLWSGSRCSSSVEGAVEPSGSLLPPVTLVSHLPPGLGLDLPPPFGAMLPMPVPPSPVVPCRSPPLDTCCRMELALHTMSEDVRWRFEEQLQAGLSWPQIDLGTGLAHYGESRTDAELADLRDEALADEVERLLRLDVASGRTRPPPLPPPPPTRSQRRRERRRERHRQRIRALQPGEVGCRVLPWLDDFAFFKQGTRAEACAERDHVFGTLESLGLQRNVTKGQPEPSHFLEDHLGYGIDTARGLFLLTEKREVKLRSLASRLLSYAARHRRFVPTRELAGFAGLGQASALAVPMARFWLRSLYDDIAEQGHRWSGLTRLSRQTMADIAEWRGLRGSRHVGRAIWRPADSAVGHVDAGPYGWGGQLDYQRSLPPAWGFWTPAEAEIHITFRELRAVRLFVGCYADALRGRRLLLYEDNQAVVAILTNLTTRSSLLMVELRKLMRVLTELDVSLRATYIRSAANDVADYFSRLARPHEYTVARSVFHRVTAWWGACTVDAFAGAATALLPRYWAESFDVHGAEAVDAFAQEWCGECAWAHPPPHMLPQLAQLLRERPGTEAYVCTPFWPGEAWYAELLGLCSERATFPAGSFVRVAPDAPERLESWPCTVFRVQPRAA